jgi:hypothetical protein
VVLAVLIIHKIAAKSFARRLSRGLARLPSLPEYKQLSDTKLAGTDLARRKKSLTRICGAAREQCYQRQHWSRLRIFVAVAESAKNIFAILFSSAISHFKFRKADKLM